MSYTIEKRGDYWYKNYNGRYRKICSFDDCIKHVIDGTNYCKPHKEHAQPDEIKKKRDEKVELEYKDGKWYRKSEGGERLKLVCNFEECVKCALGGTGYCDEHSDHAEPEEEKQERIEEELKEERKIINRPSSTAVGDATEKYVYDIINEFKSISEVELVGNTGDRYDIKYKCKDEEVWRGAQIKTISRKTGKYATDTWQFSFKNTYDADTLLIMVNVDRTRFALAFYKDCGKNGVNLAFNSKQKNRKDARKIDKFTDINEFKKQLKKSLKLSSIYEETISREQSVENKSLKRLEKACTENNLEYLRNPSNGDCIDCFINEYKIQLKSTKSKSNQCNSYRFGLYRNNGTVKGKKLRRAYDCEDEVDFFIFEITTDKNNFYIVPMKKMIQKGYIRTATQKGKSGINILLTNCKGEKQGWIHKYLNRFDLLE